MDLKQIIKNHISKMQVLQLVTTKNGKPWTCFMHYAFDRENNVFYCMTPRDTRHSKEIRENKEIFGAILVDADTKQCVKFEGEAFELTGDSVKKANEVYEKIYGHKDERLTEALSDNQAARAYYEIKPSHFYLFDLVNFPDNPRQELNV